MLRPANTLQHSVLVGGAACISMAAATAWLYPGALLPVLMLTPAALVALLMVRHPVPSSVVWLLVAGSSPEYWLGSIVPGSDATDTAMVKILGLVLVAVCIVRYGWRFDVFNPSLAFFVMFGTGLVHGLLPQLTMANSLRTLVGSVAPFAFSFSRLSRRWCQAVIAAAIWVPSFIVGFGALLAALHLYPMFADDDGFRLSGSTHPAFLATFAMTGVFAALVELFRAGRTRDQAALALNFFILLASGGRGALFGAVMVSSIAFVFLPSARFPHSRRLPALLIGGLLLAVAVAFATAGSEVRILNVLSTQADNLSNREMIWPLFERAWDASPWLGWGLGAGKELVDPDSLLAHLLGTTAAHNEYLRIGVEGGYFGLGLLIFLIAAWAYTSTRPMVPAERFILRLVLLSFAVHAFTDNILIATTASVYFAWLSAVFARARLEAETRHPVVAVPPIVPVLI